MWKFVTKVPTGTLQFFSAFFAMRFQRQWSQENSVRRRGKEEEKFFFSKWSPGNYFDFM